MLPKLFTPIKVGRSLLAHRVVFCPLTRFRADPNHVPVPLMAKYYEQRTTKGGLLISEGVPISGSIGAYPLVPGIYNQDQIEGWKAITKAVHDKEGSIYLQLWHPGRATSPALIPGGKAPVSASAIAIKGKDMSGAEYEVPRPLETKEIVQVVDMFAEAAKNAISAGFDGVEIHGANGYLIDQFINSSSNVRKDQYGGSIENRGRIALEITDAVSKAIGEDRTAVRFSPWSGALDMKDDTPYETWGYLVKQLQEKYPNLAYIHFIEPRDDFVAPASDKSRQYIRENDTIEPFRKEWKGPMIVAGGYTTDKKRAFETAEKYENTLVGFGRLFISNPDLVFRLKNDLPCTRYNRSTFYTHDSVGYTDYPFYDKDSSK
ncbi:hypothetical protein CLU79DRAFT_749718 [Phycomyces nitens]|nr:hypothetical protein CLU79DRAFT_749718 [Phycomyces nitens]